MNATNGVATTVFVLLSIHLIGQVQPAAKTETMEFTIRAAPRSPNGKHVSVIDGQHVWVGLSFTTDGGISWLQATPSAEDAKRYFDISEELDLERTYFVTERRGWLSDRGSVWQTSDAGHTWKREFQGSVAVMTFFGPVSGWMALRRVREDIADGYITHDRGITWSKCGESLAGQRLRAVSASFLTDQDGWAFVVKSTKTIEKRGVARTIDGGCTWTPIWWDPELGRNEKNGLLTNVRFASKTVGWVWGEGNGDGVILETRDGGLHWKRFPGMRYLYNAYVVGPGRGWRDEGGPGDGEDSGLSFTADGGAHWQLVTKSDIRRNQGLARQIPPNWSAGVLTKMLIVNGAGRLSAPAR